jgi:proline iminopeptidase
VGEQEPGKCDLPAQLLEKLQSKDPAVREKYARAWARYESKIAFLEMPDEQIDAFFKKWNPLAFSRLENYYMANGCFFKEGQLVEQINKLKDIPIVLINGRYDVICPPLTAYRLHKKLPKSSLYIVEKSGHSAREPGIQRQLVLAAEMFAK